jgi:DNA ligase-1
VKRFAALFAALDASTGTLDKVAALRDYFADAAPQDAAWAVYFLSGGKPRQAVPSALLRATAVREAGIAEWLFDESYQAVGDLAETIAHVLPAPAAISDLGLAHWVEQRLLPLRGRSPDDQADALASWWRELDSAGRFLLTKLIGGGFRVGVSKLLVQRALAQHAGVDAKTIAQRMMGYTDAKLTPSAARYAALLSASADGDTGQPYPFFLAHALDGGADSFAQRLGAPSDWLVEWKYDGIRAQLVRRDGQCWIWSRGEELVTEAFPEVVALASKLPDGTVLDGEILVWLNDAPAPFQRLQQRIGRKTLSRKVLAESPASFMAYDLLQWQGRDLRDTPQHSRRALLEQVCGASAMPLSPLVAAPSWSELATLRQQSRARGVEGFMLKHRDAAYGSGRTKAGGVWWKWKIEPLSVDCVLIYAQAGHGRRASVYTDYTFAVWNRTPRDATEARGVVDAITRREPAQPDALQLVPFAKAYSGLSDAEFVRVDRIIRADTLEKFGPVRSVKPSLVFELGFEGVNRSPRHKSGIAVRFPRMLRIRDDKPLHEADTLAQLVAMLGDATNSG